VLKEGSVMEYKDNFYKGLYNLSEKEIERNFEFLGQGIARKVYSIDNLNVIKMAKGLDGYYQNSIENYIYKHADSNLLNYLCPIFFFKTRMLIMRKAIPISEFMYHNNIHINSILSSRNTLYDLKNMSKKYYLYFNDIVQTRSWGILNNKCVLIDYGCPSKQGVDFYTKLFHIPIYPE
jgi:hypothetical protein